MIYPKNDQLISIILALIIPFLILGPFLPDLILSISSVFFLFYVFKNKKFYIFKKKSLMIFFLFSFYIILVTIFRAENKILSFESSLFYFRIGVFSCLIWYLIENNKYLLKYFYYSLVVCFSVLVLDGYYQFFSGTNVLGFPHQAGTRISSFFGEELIMGSYLSRLFPLLFALFLIKKKIKYENYFIALLFILIDVLIYISSERAAFFFLNLSTLFIIILIKNYQKFRLITFLISIILVTLLTVNSEKLSNRMIKGPIESMGLMNENQNKNIFTPKHDSFIKTAFNMFKDKPIFGHGPKMFRILCKNEKYQTGIKPCNTHPHNFYIQLLSETGIIGFGFLTLSFFYVIFCAFKQLNSIFFKKKRYLTDYQICLLAGILITVWPFSPNGNFFNNWLMVVYSLPIGFYLQSIYSKNKNKNIFN